MSQAKVDRYKKEKANRQQIMKKEKMERTVWKVGGSVVVLIMVGWIGFSAYNMIEASKPKTVTSETYEVNTDAITDYLSGLSGEEAE